MINRRTFLSQAAVGTVLFIPAALQAQAPVTVAPRIAAKACLVIDAVTGRTFYERNANEQRPVASTQKLLSALVAVESTDMDKMTTVNREETKVEPHKLFLKVGERLPLRTLLLAMLIESCNDCAHCMGRSCAGTVEQFAVWMNRRAAQLGCKHSHFINPSGLPARGQVSTARDMAIIARAAIYNSTIRSIVGLENATITRGDGRVKILHTTNHLLRRTSSDFYPLCTGMKTGYTNLAGKCLVSSGTYRGRMIICVMLGGNSRIIWKDSKAMLNWALGADSE